MEFNFDNLLRIRHWLFDIKQHQEMIPRNALNSDDDSLEKISKNITRQGLTNFTMNYLRVCSFFLISVRRFNVCILQKTSRFHTMIEITRPHLNNAFFIYWGNHLVIKFDRWGGKKFNHYFKHKIFYGNK